MKKLLILTLSFLSTATFAQETKFAMNKTFSYTEEYFVLKSDKKIKHGTYVKYRPSIGQPEIMESGNYVNGEKRWCMDFFSKQKDLETKKNNEQHH